MFKRGAFMRLAILLIVLLGVMGCEKTIKEVKTPVGSPLAALSR